MSVLTSSASKEKRKCEEVEVSSGTTKAEINVAAVETSKLDGVVDLAWEIVGGEITCKEQRDPSTNKFIEIAVCVSFHTSAPLCKSTSSIYQDRIP
jgi:hypothetical protein